MDPGIGGRVKELNGAPVTKLDSPKATIMALVTDGILTQQLPWGLVLIGVFITLAIELMGLQSLPVAVGVYLPISTSSAMFAGGMIRWLVERQLSREGRSAGAESGPGRAVLERPDRGGRHRRHLRRRHCGDARAARGGRGDARRPTTSRTRWDSRRAPA